MKKRIIAFGRPELQGTVEAIADFCFGGGAWNCVFFVECFAFYHVAEPQSVIRLLLE